MAKAFEAIMTIMLLFLCGFIIYKKNWVTQETMAFLSKFIVLVAVPAMLINSLTSMFSHEQLLELLPLLPMPLIMQICLYYLSYLIAVLLKVRQGRRGTFAMMGAISNTLFIGLPISMILFGEECLPGVMLTFLSSTLVCWTLGISGLMKDGTILSGIAMEKLSLWKRSKKFLLNPPILGLIIGLALSLLNIKLPTPVINTLAYIGSMVTPLSMLYTGMYLATMNWKDMMPDKDTLAVFFIRFLLAPLLMYFSIGLTRQLGGVISKVTSDVLIIQVAACVMTQSALLTIECKGDGVFATRAVALSNLVFLAVLPLYLYLLA
ncbi:AEC family transporter [uncultured Sphaerochaeta sp.]|uniref:AEC family transporter n=1 Tax=uncultured Sphaerochaeta sp. TaxID=886478 RepID=UPI002A0A3DB9|nr:AEC family transporter [uncultured Sphaerochaeta sp.]